MKSRKLTPLELEIKQGIDKSRKDNEAIIRAKSERDRSLCKAKKVLDYGIREVKTNNNNCFRRIR